MEIFAIKVTVEDGEKPETKAFLVRCVNYAEAETMAYKVAESLGFKSFKRETIVKQAIKEVHKELNPDQTMWLVKYEFGLEAKPTKSNILVSGKYMHEAYNTAHGFLDPLCDSLFITAVTKLDYIDFVEQEKSFEEQAQDLINHLDQQGMKVTFSASNTGPVQLPEPNAAFTL